MSTTIGTFMSQISQNFLFDFRYQSQLYSHPDCPETNLDELEESIYQNIVKHGNFARFHLRPDNLFRHTKVSAEKKKRGQPTSFTDWFGNALEETFFGGVCITKNSWNKRDTFLHSVGEIYNCCVAETNAQSTCIVLWTLPNVPHNAGVWGFYKHFCFSYTAISL